MTNEIKTLGNITLPLERSSKYGDVDGLSLQNLFYATNGVFPGCYLFDYDQRVTNDYTFDVEKILDYFLKNYKDELEIIPYVSKTVGETKRKKTEDLTICLILKKKQIYARFQDGVTESYILFPNDQFEEVEKIAKDMEQFYIAPEKEKDVYWRVCSSQSGFYLERGDIKAPEILDIDKLYNDDFAKQDDKINNFIETEDKSGLVILHGLKGTGKSCYIKNLIHKFPEKKFVYVPANLVSQLGEPSFGSFLSTLDNHIIVLEDCENAIRDRKTTASSASVSLLLNMTDGFLADDLGLKFICTFNENMKNIDSALLRKGRLISKYEFGPLCAEKATNLLKERGIDVTLSKPMSLADIFHYEEEGYEEERKSIID